MTPYTLSNNQVVNLRPHFAKDIESIDSWVRNLYIQQANNTVKLLPDTVQKSFMLDVLDKAMMLTTQFGDGRSMLFANVYGTARFIYSHIAEQDSITFEQFHEMVYPDGFVVDSGTKALIEMLQILYPNNPNMSAFVGLVEKPIVETSVVENSAVGITATEQAPPE
jgi:hypothetical protein